MSDPRHRPATLAVHAGHGARAPGEPVSPPIALSSTFRWARPEDGELLYTRYGNNPNQRDLARKLAALEGAEAAVALASGMAAASMTLLALTRAGDRIVAQRRLYGATAQLLAAELPRRGVETTFVDPFAGERWEDAIGPDTRVVYIEIPSNPTLRLVDPRPLAALCRERGIRLVCDATFASPVNFRGAEWGIDVVIHSATKYLGGHDDLIAGVVTGPAAVVADVVRVAKLYGPALDPHAAWLLDRGLRTLDVRVMRQSETAAALAEWFGGRPEVSEVVYPGLASHPDHRVAAELLDGFGGMLGIVVGGGGGAADRFMDALELVVPAPSLGGVETLVGQPRYMSHASLSPEERAAQGIPDGYVRVSVGVEHVEDLKADFARALERSAG